MLSRITEFFLGLPPEASEAFDAVVEGKVPKGFFL